MADNNVSSSTDVDSRCSLSNDVLAEPNTALSIAGLVMALFYWAYILVGMVWFYIRRKRSKVLQGQSLLLIPPIGVLGFGLIFLRDFIGRNQFPCGVFMLMIPWILFLGAWPLVIQVVLLVNQINYRIKLAENLYGEHLNDPKFPADINLALAEPSLITTSEYQDAESSGTLGRHISRMFTKLTTRPYNSDSIESSSTFSNSRGHSRAVKSSINSLTNHSETTAATRKSIHLPSHLSRARFFASYKFGVIAAFAPFILIMCVFPLTSQRGLIYCAGCSSPFINDGQRILMFVVSMTFFVFVGYLAFKARNEPDAFGTRASLKKMMVFTRPVVVVWLIVTLVDPDGLQQNAIFNWGYVIVIAPIYAIYVLLYSRIRQTYTEENGSNDSEDGEIEFGTFLKSKLGESYFKTHLINEVSIENYFFWKEATAWKLNYDSSSKNHRENRFLYLYDMFLDSNYSPLLVNLSGNDFEEISRIANADQLNVPKNVFDSPIRSTYHMMRWGAWPRFVISELYQQYLNDVNNDDGDGEDAATVTGLSI